MVGVGSVGGRFQLQQEVAKGGMGIVYRARDFITGETVAVKLLQGHHPEEIKRFEREAEALAGLSHRGIVRYIARGTSSAGQPYIVMEWLDAEPLSRRLERTGFTLAESVLVIRQVADALGAAHRAGLVHRDIKPTNIPLPPERID